MPTLLIALLVTALVAVPLLVRGTDADPDTIAADPASVLVDTADGAPGPLDGATISGAAIITVEDSASSAASFSLFAAGDDRPILAGQDLSGPVFSPVLDDDGRPRPLDTRSLADGTYELFIVLSGDDGEQRTAVGFEVMNP